MPNRGLLPGRQPGVQIFTPQIHQANVRIACSKAVGRWCQVGPLVWVQGFLIASAAGTLANQIYAYLPPDVPLPDVDVARFYMGNTGQPVGVFRYFDNGSAYYAGHVEVNAVRYSLPSTTAQYGSQGGTQLQLWQHDGTANFATAVGWTPNVAVASGDGLAFQISYVAAGW